MSAQKNNRVEESSVETTGHSWDGIKELNNPLPKWWLYTFYGCIIFAMIYTILYPAWPLVHGATQGILGYDSREVVAEKIAKMDEQNAPLNVAMESASFEEIVNNEALDNYAVQGGNAIFQTYCSQCHGSSAAGAVGYPSLLDDDWIWGGKFDDIVFTVTHGINDETDPDTRVSEMPSFKGTFDDAQLNSLSQYVLSLSGQANDAASATEGKTLFAENCASCHGADAKGDRNVGSLNLTDSVWLNGDGSAAMIEGIILNGRKGVMPHWGERLTPVQIKQVAVYVYQKGGGE